MNSEETQKNKKICVIACCLNEAKNIAKLYENISRVFLSINMDESWHLMIVDDGSDDNTEEVIDQLYSQNAKLEYLKLSRNFGKEAALTAGLDYAKDYSVLLIDADLQHPVELIPKMIEKWKKGADMVVGVPVQRSPDIFHKFFSYAYHTFITWSSKSPLILNGGDFRLIDQKSVASLTRLREKSRYMKGIYGYVGGHTETIEFIENNREIGITKFSYRKRLSLAINGIVSTTTVPLRFFTIIGFCALSLAGLYLIYILVNVLIHGADIPGFASLLFTSIVLNGLIMIQIGIQSEYIAKILQEVKQRSIYVVKDHKQLK